jgi:hypothetical protein
MAAVGLYALDMSREHKPGSVVGKRIMGGVGVRECFIDVLFLGTVTHAAQYSSSVVTGDGTQGDHSGGGILPAACLFYSDHLIASNTLNVCKL